MNAKTTKTTKPAKKPPASRGAPASTDVEAFLAALEHPRKPEIMVLRQILAAVDPAVREQIKWNAPSFCTSEHFATFQLRAKNGVQIIFHLGAKKRGGAALVVDDPAGLLEWLGPDRASVTFADLDDIAAKRSAFTDVLRRWIALV